MMTRGSLLVGALLLLTVVAFGQSKPDPGNKHTPVILNSNEHALPGLNKELEPVRKLEPVTSNNKGVQPTLPQKGKGTIRKKAEALQDKHNPVN